MCVEELYKLSGACSLVLLNKSTTWMVKQHVESSQSCGV